MATARKRTSPAKTAAARKPPVKAATPARPKAVASAPAPTPAKVEKAAKVDKPKKPKLVRDSFTIPKPEYTVLDDLKKRSAALGAPAKKSELLRAGIKALAAMGDPAFAAALAAVPPIKTGRPAKA